MRTRTRKILRDIWARKIRTLLVSTSIFIGVLGVVTLVTAGDLLVAQLEEDLQEERLAMIRMAVSVSSEAEIDNQAYLDALEQEDGVMVVEGRAVYPAFWRLPDEEDFENGYVATHTEPFADSYLEPTRLIDGRYPESGGSQLEIGIERRLADAYDLGVGDTLEVRLLSAHAGSEDEIRIETAEIVGVVFQPYGYRGGTGPLDADTLIFADFADAQAIADFKGLSEFLVRFESFAIAEESKADFQKSVATVSPYIPGFVNIEDPAENAQLESTRSTNQILVTLAMIALVVSGFLVINVVSSIVSEQRRQIGVMKSLGATRLDSFLIYAGIATAYGVIGVVPGVLLGIPAGYYAAQGLASQSGTVITEFGVSVSAIALGIGIGLAVPFLASIIPILNGTRVTILQAMTDLGINARFGRGRLERLLGSLPLPPTMRLSINSAFQKKFRLALTGVTLMLANGAFMGIFAVFFALTGLVDDTFATFGAQIAISPNEGQNFETVETVLRDNVDGLRDVEPGVNLAIEIQDYEPPPVTAGPPGIFATGFNTSNPDVVVLDLIEGTAWEGNPDREGVVLSSRIAQGMEVGDGDTVTILAGGNEADFEVIGVANFPFDTVWMEWKQLANFAGLTVGPESTPYPNTFDIILDDQNASAEAVDDKIESIREALLREGITAEYTNWVDFAELITRILVIFGVILSLAAFLIAAVGGVGLLTTLSMSVFERQKEIGVMRSVGATSRRIVTLFLFEGMVVGIVSWLLAIPVSLLVRQGLFAALPFDDVFEIPYPLITLVVGLGGMLFLVTIASLWPSLSAARKTVSDILRYQ